MRLSREGQTRSAKNTNPLLTTIHPFPITPGNAALTTQQGNAIEDDGRGSSHFLLTRRTDVSNETRIGSLVMLVIAPPVAETQVAVYRSSHDVRVAVILAVILPPADLAQFQGFRRRQCFISTAEAPGCDRSSHPLSMRRFKTIWALCGAASITTVIVLIIRSDDTEEILR
jgi:hypothetical protein